MGKAKHSEAQILDVLRQLQNGRTAEQVARENGVSRHTVYSWKAKFRKVLDAGGTEELARLREENARLRKLVADLSLEKDILQSAMKQRGEPNS
ncbi:MAG: transposase [Hyphomicrobium sp.]